MNHLAATIALLATAVLSAQQPKPPFLLPGLGDLHHPVSTTNAEAQQFFDQGLRLVYAFNHDEGVRSFLHAAELDPHLAMAWWGVALAAGPNYNLPVDPDHERVAADAIDKARALKSGASQMEKDYIETLGTRFSHSAQPDYQQLNADYANAMRTLSHKYPDDLDAATLFADSMMNLHPWKLWNADGTAAPGTEEIVTTLQGVLRRDPHHIGAMHLYIHAVEASPHPELALTQAQQIASLAPGAGHLVHMPAHIYERVGDYDGARVQNLAAAKADESYAAATGSQGLYMMMYYSHNLHFGAISASMQGHCAEARQAADHLADNLRPMVKDMPMVEPFLGIPMAVAVRCGRWDDVLVLQEPDSRTLRAFWLYGRGLALTARGNVSEADALHKKLEAIVESTPSDELFMPPVENHSRQIFQIASDVLGARIAAAKGDRPTAISLLRAAVANQDKLLYDEPADWYYPVRETLGGMLLQSGDVKGAEEVFRADLEHNPRNPRSLFGLAEALVRQSRNDEAYWVKQQFAAAWKDADIQLKVEDL